MQGAFPKEKVVVCSPGILKIRDSITLWTCDPQAWWNECKESALAEFNPELCNGFLLVLVGATKWMKDLCVGRPGLEVLSGLVSSLLFS
jgi:hypothetical protein